MARKLSLGLPSNIDLTSPVGRRLLNERLSTISAELAKPLALSDDLDAGGHKIVNLGDATSGLDALSRSVGDRRYLGTALPAAVGSQTTTIATAAAGKRQLLLSVPGTLGIGSSLAPLVSLDESRTASGLVALVKRAPTGASLRIQVNLGGTKWAAIAIADGAASATLSSAGLGSLAKDALVTVDVVGCGTTFPGGDLSLMIRFA